LRQTETWEWAIRTMAPGVLKTCDAQTLRLFCEAEERHHIAEMELREYNETARYKLIVATPTGGLAQHPANRILNETTTLMIRLISELGFSPASRPRLHADPPTIDARPEDDLRADPWSFLGAGAPN